MANQATPLAVDLYSRFMAREFDERTIIGVPTAFQAFFGNPANGSMTLFSPDSTVVEIDILRGNEKLAALIQRGGNSRPLDLQLNTNEQKFTSFSRVYPLIEEEGDINSSQLVNRIAGENPYEAMTQLDRMRSLAANGHNEHIRRITRTFEFLAAESVLNGTMPAIIGTTNTDLIYDFRRNAANTITVSTQWDDPAAVIMNDFDDAADQARINGHVTVDMSIIGGDSMDALIKDSEVKEIADNRRFELIEVSLKNPVPAKFDRFIASGLEARGRVRTPKGREIWLFTYLDGYDNTAGTFVNYMPLDKALVCFSGARADRYFGPNEVLPRTSADIQFYREVFGFDPVTPPMPPNIKGMSDIVNPAMFYNDAYGSNDRKKVSFRTQSAPIFATTMTDAFVTLEGLV